MSLVTEGREHFQAVSRAIAQFGAGVGRELFPDAVERSIENTVPPWQIDSAGAYCTRCGESIGPYTARETGCLACASRPIAWDRIVRLGPYRTPLSNWIVAMKFARTWRWTNWMGQHLAKAIPPSNEDRHTALCPVPMHWRRRTTRGYNQAELMARVISVGRGWPTVRLLKRVRNTRPQTAVILSARAANVRGSLAARPFNLAGWDI